MTKRFYRLQPLVLLLPVLFSLSVARLAAQDVLDKTYDVIIDEPKDWVEDAFDHDDHYVTRQKTTATQGQCGWSDTAGKGMSPEVVKLDTLIGHQEDYYGRTVTVEGEMHRFFTDNVFTIEDDDFFRDDDVLVINRDPGSSAIVPLNDSLESGKNVQITALVRPYDRGALECAYGPLHLESREGHSFTKGPVLIIVKPEVAKVEPPPVLEKPLPPPVMAPPPEPIQPPAVILPEPEPILPKTNSNVPLTALIGLMSLSAAFLCRRYANRPDR